MSHQESARGGVLPIDQLVALNDEIAALVRAGVPLERGLAAVAEEMPGRLRDIGRQLAEQLAAGTPLPQAIAARHEFPPIYRAVIEAGLKSGRLPVALESLAYSARRMIELQRSVALALFYPLMILLLAYALFVGYLLVVWPAFAELIDESLPPLLDSSIDWVLSHIALWGPIIPVLLLLGAILWWYASRRPRDSANGRLGWMPRIGSYRRNQRLAAFAEMLALLVEQQVALPEAVRLAADASGDANLERGSRQLAASIEAGAAPANLEAFPPLLGWLISSAAQGGRLPIVLRQAAEIYRRRALRQADWIRLYLPTILLVTIGGLAVLLYSLALFLPWAWILRDLANPPGGI